MTSCLHEPCTLLHEQEWTIIQRFILFPCFKTHLVLAPCLMFLAELHMNRATHTSQSDKWSLYSYNCPLRWIHCKEIVFDLANDSYPISIAICCPIGWIYGIEIVFDQAYDSVRSLHKYLYRDRISDLYSYILSDRMDIWYRDQKWMLSRIVHPGYPWPVANELCWQLSFFVAELSLMSPAARPEDYRGESQLCQSLFKF